MKRLFLFVSLFSLILTVPQCVSVPAEQTAVAPVAQKIPKEDVYHGDQRVDDYYWLREKDNPDVAAYLEAENVYAEAIVAPIRDFQETLYEEMLGRIQQTDLSVPYQKGGYLYYSRTEEGKQYPIRARKKGSMGAFEQVTLDMNQMAEGYEFFHVGAFEVSNDTRLLAFSTDVTGFRQYTLQVKNLETGEIHPDKVEKVVSVAWAGDSQTLFYTVEDHAKRPYRLYRHRLGTDPASDPLIYEEKDERFRIDVRPSRSQAYLFLDSGSHTSTEVRYLPANQPEGEWKIVQSREPEHEYSVDHRGNLFYILTNDKGRNFRLVSAPVSAPRKAAWKEVIPHREEVMLEGIDFFADHYVVRERENGLQQFRITSLRSGQSHRMAFPEPVYSVFPSQNPEFDTELFRFNYQSFTTPPSVFDYSMDTRERQLLKETEVLGDYDNYQYESERVYARAADGVQIPISLVYRKGTARDGKSPMLLYAYGSYGYPSNVTFAHARISLLDRGVIYALAHIRGGGDLGKKWHDDGRMMKKMNTFTDFIACADHLVAQKYTSSDRLAISGGSAGGLLMGAVANLRPDLFKVVLSYVPFVDVINTMMDETLPLTIGEFEEWGNPKVKEEYECMKTYCPYTNLEKKDYPVILIRTSFNDSQVMYWEPAKYVAKLRTLKTDDNPLLLLTNMAAGHGGASGRYDALRDTAFDYAFLLTQFGITPNRVGPR
jgi:oligopeptidase B